MNERELRAIDGRLSLRAPQREALELLANVSGSLTLAKDADAAASLAVVKGLSPTVEDFERNFPSLCFALATGVGKTRLMGAFIAYLYRVHGLKHFFVLAPNLTIYEKLKEDFTYGSPKFVFPGLGDIRDNLVVITGDDWEDGRGVRERDLRGDAALRVNIFNVAKINTEVRAGASPRMKRLHEVIGDSYFDYLAKLDDLVLLMDESHRYRAQAGAKAIEGLRPVLGLELTATPQLVQGARVTRFKNIAYEYPLANAIRDGFVKVPAVATRANFNPRDYDADALERLKLEDGMTLHERTKVELDAYADDTGQTRVKPFVLVVAEDTAHASALHALIESATFSDGRYKGRVIEVHSNQTGDIKDESLQRLLRVEDPAEPTEVVIHVNKLGEGWDVTNLYTIIPLRAASSVNLVEQSLGRGLRLPYGRRTGNEAVDTLTVVAHEHFDAIVQRAREPGSVVQAYREVVLDRQTATPVEKVRARPRLDEIAATPMQQSVVAALSEPGSNVTWEQLRSPVQREVAKKAVHERLAASPEALPLALDDREFHAAFETAVTAILEHSIGIPRVTLRPRGAARLDFREFTVSLGEFRPRPLAQEILVKQLQAERTRLVATGLPEDLLQPEQHLVRLLSAHPSVSYERHAELLFDLAGQVVSELSGYLRDSNEVANVVFTQGRILADRVLEQMHRNRKEIGVEYEATIRGDVHRPREVVSTAPVGSTVVDFRQPVADLAHIRRVRFGGFKRCLFSEQRFDSDAERRFAMILEDDPDTKLKWFKPALGDVRIWLPGGQQYNPDFVVETADIKLLVEPKADDEVDSQDVQSKAKAAVEWCSHATSWESLHGGKPWTYLLLPESAITSSATLGGLRSMYALGAKG